MFRAALYLETPSVRVFDLDFTEGRFVGLGHCSEDRFGNYGCS
jgi:hypothetical protein